MAQNTLVVRSPLISLETLVELYPKAYDLAVWFDNNGESALEELRRTLKLGRFNRVVFLLPGDRSESLKLAWCYKRFRVNGFYREMIKAIRKLQPRRTSIFAQFTPDNFKLSEPESPLENFVIGFFCIDPRLNNLAALRSCDLIIREPGGYSEEGKQLKLTMSNLAKFNIKPTRVVLSGHTDCLCENAEIDESQRNQSYGQELFMRQPAAREWGDSANILIKTIHV